MIDFDLSLMPLILERMDKEQIYIHVVSHTEINNFTNIVKYHAPTYYFYNAGRWADRYAGKNNYIGVNDFNHMISIDDTKSIPENATVVDVENFYDYFIMSIKHYQNEIANVDIMDLV